jgi:hypothetical protein
MKRFAGRNEMSIYGLVWNFNRTMLLKMKITTQCYAKTPHIEFHQTLLSFV